MSPDAIIGPVGGDSQVGDQQGHEIESQVWTVLERASPGIPSMLSRPEEYKYQGQAPVVNVANIQDERVLVEPMVPGDGEDQAIRSIAGRTGIISFHINGQRRAVKAFRIQQDRKTAHLQANRTDKTAMRSRQEIKRLGKSRRDDGTPSVCLIDEPTMLDGASGAKAEHISALLIGPGW